MEEHDQTQDAMEIIEALLKDIERALDQRGELNEHYKTAIERLRRLCGEEKSRPSVEKTVGLRQDLGTDSS